MLRQRVELHFDESGRPLLDVSPPGGCDACEKGYGCGALKRKTVQPVDPASVTGLDEGTACIAEISESQLIAAAWVAYGLPLALGLLGIIAGQFLNDTAAAAGFAIGVGTGWFWARNHRPQVTLKADRSAEISAP